MGGRRYLTLCEQTHQKLEAAGAKKFKEWAAEKHEAHVQEQQRVVVSMLPSAAPIEICRRQPASTVAEAV